MFNSDFISCLEDLKKFKEITIEKEKQIEEQIRLNLSHTHRIY